MTKFLDTVKRRKAGATKKVQVTKETLRQQLLKVNELAAKWKERMEPHKCGGPPKLIRTASDCSGYGSDLIAYKFLVLQRRIFPVQWTEVDANKIVLHEAVAKECGWKASLPRPCDMMSREPSECLRADVYVAGYPCPSFSNLGKGRGVNDSRGLLTLKGMEYIARTRPKMIVLEQVAAILQKKHEKVWNYVLKILKSLEYKYVYRVLNTKAFAVPQSRPRVYLLAVASEICQGALALPDERTQPVDLHHFLQKEVKGTEVLALPKYERLLGAQMWRKGYVLDVGSSEKFQSVVHNATPCLTRTRLSQRGYYIPKLQRRLLPEEAAALQGIPSQVFASMVAAATDFNIPSNAVAGSLGDGMSINVLTSVLMKGLHHSGLARYESRHEHWRLVENSEAAGLSDKLFQSSVLKLATATHATRNR